MKFRKITLVAALFFGTLGVAGCTGDGSDRLHKESRLLMGTLVEVTAVGPRDKAAAAIQAALDEIKRVEDLTSFHKPSALARLNEAAGTGAVVVDPELFTLVERSLKIARDTNGAFDPTIGPLTRLWHFSAGEPRLPDPSEIAEALGKLGWEKIKLDPHSHAVLLTEPGMAIDLGAFAKGYALERARDRIKERGISSALVNIGGDIMAMGEKEPGKPWRVGIQDPRNPTSMVAVVAAKDRAVITSGDYERFFVKEGKRYHHILDPKTGYPAESLQSATILADDPSTTQPMGTALFVLGVQEGLKYVESKPGLEALLIDSSGTVRLSRGAESFLDIKK
jgi:FAD:protein FMN transferase